jgi:hypothetical protein
MSEYDFFEGLDGSGDEPAADQHAFDVDAQLFGSGHGGQFDTDVDAGFGDAYPGDVHDGDVHDGDAHQGDGRLEDAHDGAHHDADVNGDHAELAPADGAHNGLLDGLNFELDNLDLAGIADMAFHAAYDMIGSAPDENGWWDTLASDNNHDGAYDEVSYDPHANPYVTH